MTGAEKAAHCINWRRQRRVLEALSQGRTACWQPYDWDADDGCLAPRPICCEPGEFVILEGAYSARPEHSPLLDLRVLLDVPAAVRRERLLQREGDTYRADWEVRWAEAEVHYFGSVMPAAAFDLVVEV